MQETSSSSNWKSKTNPASDVIIEEMETTLIEEVSKFSGGPQDRNVNTVNQPEENDESDEQMDIDDVSERNWKVVILPEKKGLMKVSNEDMAQYHKTVTYDENTTEVSESISDAHVSNKTKQLKSDKTVSDSSETKHETRRRVENVLRSNVRRTKTVNTVCDRPGEVCTEETSDSEAIQHPDKTKAGNFDGSFHHVSIAIV